MGSSSSSSTISACYATGDASGSGRVGGLVGWNNGAISACYATGGASGSGSAIGGLVGYNNSGTISACYATGDANGSSDVGGLVGYNNSGTISACYATGNVSGSSQVGGLVGENYGTVTNSYFDSTVNSALATTPIGGGTTTGSSITNVSGKTTTQLQTPTVYGTGMDIYANWNIDVDNGLDIGVNDGTMPGDATADDPWDFGTNMQYPALRVDFDRSGTPSAAEFGGQGRAAPTAPAAPSALTETAADAAVTLSWDAPVNDGGAAIINYIIEYSVNADFSSSTTLPTADASTLSHTVTALTNGTLYYFRVAAVNSVGAGAYYPGLGGTAVSATPVAPLAISSISPTSGAVGETVMITGTGFGTIEADNTVIFLGSSSNGDEQTAAISATSTTSLSVTVPIGAVTGRISVTVGGQTATSSTDFTVLIFPPDTDADGLIDITTLAQLDAIRYDLDGDGRPTSAGQTAWETAFSAVVTVDDAAAVRDGSSSFTGYELMNSLDFEDANGDGTADDKSIWAEGASGAGVSGAVAEGWAPIGDNSSFSSATKFTATFDGKHYTISNLYINRPSTSYVGLFGALASGSNLRNLGIEGGSLTGGGNVGGLVGWNSGTISACYATGTVTGSANNVGGLVGGNSNGTIGACYATGDANGSNQVGGLVGWNNFAGTISACYATGAASGASQVGGLMGFNAGAISACYATGAASGTRRVGGLMGWNSGTISACYATGDATGTGDNVGGLVGYNNAGTISACYATGDANGSSEVGGLVGRNPGGMITNSYFDSSVSNRPATDSYDKTTTDLQTPTAYGTGTDIYANWNIDVDNAQPIGVDDGTMPGDAAADDPWDFGTNMQYPALQVDFSVDGTASVAEFGTQPRTVLFRVSSFTPERGVVGATVTIRGRAFGATATDNTVVFLGAEGDADNAEATVSAATASSLTVTVPPNAQTGPISVMVGTAADTSDASFTVTPVVSSFSPTEGAVGETVMITGTGFGTIEADNTVIFLGSSSNGDEQTAAISATSTTLLTVTVPIGAVTGKIQVAVSSEVTTSTADFTVLMSVPPTDTDADGLIDITTLAQLDAIRYDLDGDGRPTSAGQTAWQTAFSAVVTVDDDDAVRDGSSSFTGYELMNSLDFAGTKWENPTGGTFAGTHETGGWAPLGYYNSSTDNASYTATFDGRGYTISNLYINRPSTSYVGLFGFLGTGGNVRNLGIEGGSLTGADQVGGLVGSNSSGTISACYATGDANGSNQVGGLVGWNNGAISACYATGGASGSASAIGGLVGYNNSGTISACYATGDANGSSDVGGLVGYNNSGTISACYATGNASGNSSVGGLVGFSSSGTISACYATGDASGSVDIGGLVGSNNGTISACYATGGASGSGFAIGGLVGYNNDAISACYAIGDANGSSDVGGLVGRNPGGMITNSYFDSDVSNRPDTDSHAKTNAELQTPTAYAGIYSNWNVDVDNTQPIGVDNGTAAGDAAVDNVWDFGLAVEYPALRVDFNRDGIALSQEFGGQPRNAPLRVTSISPTSGAESTDVVISGTGFSLNAADNTVTFLGDINDNDDNRPASVSTSSLRSMTVSVPSGAKTGSDKRDGKC